MIMILNGIIFGTITFLIKRFVLLFDSKHKIEIKLNNFPSYIFELLFFSFIYILSEILTRLTGVVDFNYIFIALIIIPLLLSFDFYLKPYYYSFFDKNSERLLDKEKFILKKTGNNVKVFKIRNNELNMYATGIVNESHSILIGDKMLEVLDEEDLCNLIYHEIGHLNKKHLLIMYVINVFIIVCYFFSSIWLHPIFLKFNLIFEGLFVFCHGMSLGLFLVVIPGLVQKKLELIADREAVKYTSKDSYISTLEKLNFLTDHMMENKSINYPILADRIRNVQES